MACSTRTDASSVDAMQKSLFLSSLVTLLFSSFSVIHVSFDVAILKGQS